MPIQAKKCPCGYLDDARRLWTTKMCLEPVSKNLHGELRLLDRERQECEEPKCLTLKTDHFLRLRVESNEPCDSDLGKRLDGMLGVRRLVHALHDGTGMGRGPHTGEFVWVGNGFQIQGEMSGMTNVGTHREPAFDPCQECHAPGFMEGRLCGVIRRAENEALVGCRVTAVYRIRFDPSEGFQDTDVRGTLEGVVVCTCEEGKCLDFSQFSEGSHSNPWEIDGCVFAVSDYAGAPTASVDVTTMGGYTGLNAGFQTKIVFPDPVDEVTITLVNFSTPANATAFDTLTNVIDSASMSMAGVPETLQLTGPGIKTVLVRSPQNETVILEVCTKR